MKKLYLLNTIIFLLLSFALSSQVSSDYDRLSVLNPNFGNWTKVPASFQNVQMTITPSGVYANVEFEMEVSAKNSDMYYSGDSLEIEYYFTLPEGAMIHDAWLWMEGIPVQAKLYEKEEARMIYESYVSRRTDPLIIFQYPDNKYEARIYPVLNPEPRKFRMSFLIPIRANLNGLELPVPLSIIKQDLSGYPNPDIKVRVVNNPYWGDPTIQTEATSVSNNGSFTEMTINASTVNRNNVSNFYFKNYIRENIFVTQSDTSSSNGFYQMMLIPEVNAGGGKYVFGLDYSSFNNTDINYTQLVSAFRKKLLYELSPNDSFNIVYNKSGNAKLVSSEWIKGDTASINAAVDIIAASQQVFSSTLYAVLQNGIEFLNDNGKQGHFYLLSNSSSMGSSITGLNQGISSILAMMDEEYPVYIFDFNSSFNNGIYLNNNYSYNNEYFLQNLSMLSGGEYFARRNVNEYYYYYYSISPFPFSTTFNKSWSAMKKNYDFIGYNYSYSGFLHQEYNCPQSPNLGVGDAYIEVGRYANGTGSITVNQYQSVNGSVSEIQHTIPPIVRADELTEKMWAGNHIKRLTSMNSTGSLNGQIIATSLKYNVLSEKTAFLALEPDTVNNSNNIPTTVSVQNVENIDLSFVLTAYPNPFAEKQSIRAVIPQALMHQEWKLLVTDVTGRVVSELEGNTEASEELVIEWYKNDEQINSGIYFISLSVNGVKQTLRVVKN
jgi:hypothetical protein